MKATPQPRGAARAVSASACRLSRTTRRSAPTTSTTRSIRSWSRASPIGSATSSPIDDPSERDRFRMLIEREARLLDQLRFDEWLAMYAPECIYWVPGTPDARRPAPRDCDLVRRPPADGRPHLSPAHRLRLVAGAKIAHRAHGLQRRGVRHRAERDPHGALEFPDQRIPGGRNALSLGLVRAPLVEKAHRWQIEVRQVNLIDCDQNLRNPSIVL